MAITRTQIAKQLLANGGRIGLVRGGRRGDTGQASQSESPSFGGGDERRPDMLGVSRAAEAPNKPKEQPNLLKALGLSILGGAVDIPLGLINKFKDAPDFVQPQDFGPANQRLLYRQMMAQGPRNMDTMPTEEEEETPFRLSPRFRAEGGSMNDEVVGGEYDFESAREGYKLGKLVKKVTRTVKKIAKSPVGKAAIAYGLYQGYQNPAFKKFLFGAPGAITGGVAGVPGQVGTFATRGAGSKGLLGVGGRLTNMGALKGILGLSAVAGLTAEEQEDETVSPEQLGPRLNIPEYRRDPFGNLAVRFRAEGGSTEQKEPVAKKTMPLLNMGGMEKDYREDGGFVPIGRMEKADDVPARLSKNEFVFTADAVRNAGEGDVDKGAEVMYNMMKNLESGGEVSEESQGLEGARKMFQTSQRLEEVL